MSIALQKLDISALHKLLRLAKSLDDVLEKSQDRAIDQVLVRTTQEGELTFQAKGGTLWRLMNITLPGRQKEYDLTQNFRNVQALFAAIEGFASDEIRRAAQRIEIAADGNVAKGDVISSLLKLQKTFNSIIDLVKDKKASKEQEASRKQHIIDAFDKMKIHWSVSQAKKSTQTMPSESIEQTTVETLSEESSNEKCIKESKRASGRKVPIHENSENMESSLDSTEKNDSTIQTTSTAPYNESQDFSGFEATVLEVYAELQKIARDLTLKARTENEFERAFYEGRRKRVQQLQRSVAHMKNELAQKLPLNMDAVRNKLQNIVKTLSSITNVPEFVSQVAKSAQAFRDEAHSVLKPIHEEFLRIQTHVLSEISGLTADNKQEMQLKCTQFQTILESDLSRFEQLKNFLIEYGRTESDTVQSKIFNFLDEKVKTNSKEYLVLELQNISKAIMPDDLVKTKSPKKASRKKDTAHEGK